MSGFLDQFLPLAVLWENGAGRAGGVGRKTDDDVLGGWEQNML